MSTYGAEQALDFFFPRGLRKRFSNCLVFFFIVVKHTYHKVNPFHHFELLHLSATYTQSPCNRLKVCLLSAVVRRAARRDEHRAEELVTTTVIVPVKTLSRGPSISLSTY